MTQFISTPELSISFLIYVKKLNFCLHDINSNFLSILRNIGCGFCNSIKVYKCSLLKFKTGMLNFNRFAGQKMFGISTGQNQQHIFKCCLFLQNKLNAQDLGPFGPNKFFCGPLVVHAWFNVCFQII